MVEEDGGGTFLVGKDRMELAEVSGFLRPPLPCIRILFPMLFGSLIWGFLSLCPRFSRHRFEKLLVEPRALLGVMGQIYPSPKEIPRGFPVPAGYSGSHFSAAVPLGTGKQRIWLPVTPLDHQF